jgi:hypothetical protein
MDYRGMGHYDPTVTASPDEMLRTYNIHLIPYSIRCRSGHSE